MANEIPISLNQVLNDIEGTLKRSDGESVARAYKLICTRRIKYMGKSTYYRDVDCWAYMKKVGENAPTS